MSCLTDNQVSALVEGALTDFDATPAWAHVSGCTACAQLVSSLAEHFAVEAPKAVLTPRSLEGARWAGRYVVGRRLGSGKRGVTFEAVEVLGGERVALKLLWAGGDAWAAAAAPFLKWRHVATTGVRAFGVVDAQPWLVSELIDGAASLHGRALSWAEAWPLFSQVARTLDDVHRAGLVHGAVSLSSVLVRGERAWLGDFALVYAPKPGPGQVVVAERHDALGPVGDQRAFCKALQRCVGDDVPRGVVDALQEGLESRFASMAALREALSV